MKKVLTIAGSDCSGGAGIQADIKTITAHKMFAMSAITSLTAQNTMGVYDVLDAGSKFLGEEIDAIFTDIVPDAVKIGMVSNIDMIKEIANKLTFYKAENIVLDPVMVATSGGVLLQDNAVATLIEELLPIADIITPNIPEAEILADMKINSKEDMVEAAKKISKNIKADILIKGGHFEERADDLIYSNNEANWLVQERIDTNNTHGTGCTLSSAIACNLAKGCSTLESVKNAKEYITLALKSGLDIGKGSGPLNHMVM